jgi:hypothetical protein
VPLKRGLRVVGKMKIAIEMRRRARALKERDSG